ncbi:MAG: nucleotide exchange factor GrpE [Candidatus Micrarchaeaceae archaeon]
MVEEKKEKEDKITEDIKEVKNTQEKEDKKEEPKNKEDELKDRLLRLAAEFDNYKKRTVKDIENAKNFGKAEFAIKILPILDEFELAIESMKLNNEGEKGVGMVFSNLLEVLKKEGLKEIDTKGKFDPYKHEIMISKNNDQEEGTIIQVVRKGYTLNNMMLRPASVIISNGKKEKGE